MSSYTTLNKKLFLRISKNLHKIYIKEFELVIYDIILSSYFCKENLDFE